MKIRAAVFDMDNTLIISEPKIFSDLVFALEKFGMPMSEKELTDIRSGMGGRPLEVVLRQYYPDRPDSIINKVLEYVQEQDKINPPPLAPLAIETLAALREEKRQVALLTNRSKKVLDQVFESYPPLERFFSPIATCECPEEAKPNPKLMNQMLGHLEKIHGIGKDEVVLIGDRPESDGECAVRAGVACIGVAYPDGLVSHIDLREGFMRLPTPPLAVIHSLEELPAVIREIENKK